MLIFIFPLYILLGVFCSLYICVFKRQSNVQQPLLYILKWNKALVTVCRNAVGDGDDGAARTEVCDSLNHPADSTRVWAPPESHFPVAKPYTLELGLEGQQVHTCHVPLPPLQNLPQTQYAKSLSQPLKVCWRNTKSPFGLSTTTLTPPSCVLPDYMDRRV